jgi:hypothetical protein
LKKQLEAMQKQKWWNPKATIPLPSLVIVIATLIHAIIPYI